MMLKPCNRIRKGKYLWCVELEAYTNVTHCLICEQNGKEYTKQHFAGRDGKKTREPRKPSKKTKRAPRPPRIQIPPEIEKACMNCHESKSCPNTSVCCGGQILVRPQVPCPQDMWTLQTIGANNG